jgi:hypothetical protein
MKIQKSSQLQYLLDIDKILTNDVRFYMDFEQFKSASVPRDLSHKIESFIEEHFDVFNNMNPIKNIDSQYFDSIVSEIRQYFDEKLKSDESNELVSSESQQGTATYSQTLLNGLYDVAASVIAKVKLKFSKPVDSSPPPVQLTILDLLRDLLLTKFKQLQALFFPWSETVIKTNGHPKPEFKNEYYSRYNALNSAYFELKELRLILAVSSY